MKCHTLNGIPARISGRTRLFASDALAIISATVLCLAAPGNAASPSNLGPVRLARFANVSSGVSWRPDGQAAWSRAVRNLPLRQGAEIAADRGSRAEIQFDDGTRLWMATGAFVSLRSLYSDAEGEFTEITVRKGTVGLCPRNARSVYQVDTPLVSVDAAGPSRFRIDATYGVQVRGRQGRITIEGSRGKANLDPGDYVDLRSEQDPYDIRDVPPPDAFDNWTSNQYANYERYRQSPSRRYVPSNVSIVSDDLGDYGTWRTNHKYGRVWYPRERASGWRPYHSGHWVWVSPFGWTWVATEPWGWAPYHYGSWIYEPDGWAWVPGPARQCWSPAAVEFSESNGNVAWCALAPSEVRYQPALSIGYRGGDWALTFSIGAAAVYYPTQQGYCVPRQWSTGYVNNATYVNNVTNINNYYGGTMTNHNRSFTNQSYVPINARYAAGASQAQAGVFGGRGTYQTLPRGVNPAFTRGRRIGAPTGDFTPVAGPPAARLTAIALYPTRNLQRGNPVSRTVIARPVFQARGAPGDRTAVQQARSIGAATGRNAGVNAGARVSPNRASISAQRGPVLTRPNVAAGRSVKPPNQRASRSPSASPAQRAIQARSALGRPTRANRAAPSTAVNRANPGAQQRGARASQASPTQRAANQARSAIGQRPNAGAASSPRNGASNRTTNKANSPRQARPVQTPRSSAQQSAPQQRQHNTPRAQQNRQPAQPRVQRAVPQPQQRQQNAPRVQQNRQPAQPRVQRAVPQPQQRQQNAPRVQQNRQPAQPRVQRASPQPQQRQQNTPRAQQNRQQAPRSAPHQRQKSAPSPSGQSDKRQKQRPDQSR